MQKIFILLLMIMSSGCTFVGVLLDGQAVSNADDNQRMNNPARSTPYKNPLEPVPVDKDGFNFTDLGLKIDSAVFGLVKGDDGVIKKCRQVTKVLKECVEVDKSTLHSSESKQLKTDDEIISVGL
ncbi:hypothetical protein [Pseudoalteromonas sp. KJ71-7]|uniref:hypothetical protein n=1 Tax=unclassified Pseudoalteromonas TaxID=194690 RepID=UPI0039B0770E|nr:hypothetical protein [Ningiella sp. W23]